MSTMAVYRLKRMRALFAGLSWCFAVAASNAGASAQLAGVEFRAGHPLTGESLTDAVTTPDDNAKRALKEDADVLREMPSARVQIVGFTDSTECMGRQCYELSLRRARVVYEWLVAHGVPRGNLVEPVGRGSEMAIDDNGTEAGRQRNRRAEVNMIRSDVVP